MKKSLLFLIMLVTIIFSFFIIVKAKDNMELENINIDETFIVDISIEGNVFSYQNELYLQCPLFDGQIKLDMPFYKFIDLGYTYLMADTLYSDYIKYIRISNSLWESDTNDFLIFIGIEYDHNYYQIENYISDEECLNINVNQTDETKNNALKSYNYWKTHQEKNISLNYIDLNNSNMKNQRSYTSNLPNDIYDKAYKMALTNEKLENFPYPNYSFYDEEGRYTDDYIINLIPKELFFAEGHYVFYGREYGYYCRTIKKSDGLWENIVFLFDIELKLPGIYLSKEKSPAQEDFYIKIKPILQYEYTSVSKDNNIIGGWDNKFDPKLNSVVHPFTTLNKLYIKDFSFDMNVENSVALNYGQDNYDSNTDNGSYITGYSIDVNGKTINDENKGTYADVAKYINMGLSFVPYVGNALNYFQLVSTLYSDLSTSKVVPVGNLEQINFLSVKKDQINYYGGLLKNVSIRSSNVYKIKNNNYFSLDIKYNTTPFIENALFYILRFSIFEDISFSSDKQVLDFLIYKDEYFEQYKDIETELQDHKYYLNEENNIFLQFNLQQNGYYMIVFKDIPNIDACLNFGNKFINSTNMSNYTGNSSSYLFYAEKKYTDINLYYICANRPSNSDLESIQCELRFLGDLPRIVSEKFNLEFRGQIFEYEIKARWSGEYKFYTTGWLDTELYLYDENNNLIAYNDNYSPEDPSYEEDENARIDYYLEFDKKYKVVVKANNYGKTEFRIWCVV